MTTRTLREQGLPSATVQERCRPDGPWQMPLPGVCVLHPGPTTSEERLHAVVLYAGRGKHNAVPGQDDQVMITGLAALALHGFATAPPLLSLERIDVLVPRTRRLRSTGLARVVRAHTVPRPEEITGLPVAPVARALADAVGQLADAAAVQRLLTETVRGGHCEAQSVVRQLAQARLLLRPHVVDAVDTLIAEDRAMAEGRLYEMVHAYGLPDPCWDVDLRLPGGPHLGGFDAYWPDHAVALEIDSRSPNRTPEETDTLWSRYAHTRETLERLGVTVVYLTPEKLRDALEQQATVVRTALMAADEREPAAYVVVRPK